MDKLKSFSEEERKVLRENLENLLIAPNGTNLISGFNCYEELVRKDGIVISLSYQHRFADHIEAILKDIKNDSNISQVLSEERLNELKLKRNKRALYRWDNKWPIPKNEEGKVQENLDFIDLKTGLLIEKRELDNVFTLEELNGGYRPSSMAMALRENDGLELNLNIKTREEAQRIIDLFRRKAFRMKVDSSGLIIFKEGRMENVTCEIWPLSDVIPCIILGRSIVDFLSNKPLDFTRSNKISIIKDANEVSFIIHKNYFLLRESLAYCNLQKSFNVDDLEVYVNNAFVYNYIDK